MKQRAVAFPMVGLLVAIPAFPLWHQPSHGQVEILDSRTADERSGTGHAENALESVGKTAELPGRP
jgi:hypothetical protein